MRRAYLSSLIQLPWNANSTSGSGLAKGNEAEQQARSSTIGMFGRQSA
jgi:hypothetical protein